jgi:acyl carrier protein
MIDVRELIKESLDYPALLDDIADHDDLIMAGINSGEMVRIALACERHLDREITDEELSRLKSVRAVADLLDQTGGS